ncbi:protein kinase domain-containing protein [Pseudanabaena sp. PCC 6802]|uniref:serine/threonine-protein kinase n=1 Tax=Pseudanabaena sp. PCC 6802 TaxID=118173 RepID=UPI000349A6DE|nr:serine/threonine-protein kinase [Pseudanabaena sp. PCC 6802]
MIGTILRGRYAILQQLGTGGFGETYIAEDRDLPGSPKCVVKRLKPQSADPFVLQTAKRLFDTEAAVLYQLGSHDQIPRLMAHFEEDRQFYLVQEFVEGRDLSQELLPGVRWSEGQVLAFLRDILGILEFVHQQNVIHRDIKPANIIRRYRDSKLALIDFGAVKEIRSLVTTIQAQSGNSVAVGTPGYMPGEQAVGKPRFSSDIYALGMTAVQALTGMPPEHLKEDITTGEVAWRQYAQVSEATARVIDKMVRSHFRDRYQSAREVLSDLGQTVGTTTVERTQQPFKLVPVLAGLGIIGTVIGAGLAAPRFWTQANIQPPITPVTASPSPSPNTPVTPVAVTPTPTPISSPTAPPVKADAATDAIIDRGADLWDNRKYAEALVEFDKAIAINGNYDRAWSWRASALNSLKRYNEALEAADKAISLNHNNAYALSNRGFALEKLMRYDEALAAYDRAVEINPNLDFAWKGRSAQLNFLERYNEALEAADKAISLNAKDAYTFANRGFALEKLMREDEALEAYKQAVRIAPNDAFLAGYRDRLEQRLKSKG